MIEHAYALIILSLASARIAVLVVHDTILEPARVWFYRRFPPMDNPMHGYDYQTRDKDGEKIVGPGSTGTVRKWYWFSELTTCTRCMTVWITMVAWMILEFIPASLLGFEVIAVMWAAAYGAKNL